MSSLSTLVTSKSRTPTATVRLNGQRWYTILSLSRSQAFGGNISGGRVEGRDPPVTPTVGMSISWTWGYNGVEVAGFTGEVTDVTQASYPARWTLEVKDVLHRADRVNQVIVTDPLNNITATDAVEYILTHYGGISASRLAIPALQASGSEWAGSDWTLGTLTPVAWGDSDTDSGGTTALKAAQEICSVLGYFLHADASGKVTAKQMERRPSSSPLRTFQRGVDLLVQGAPTRQSSADGIRNRVIVRGANTGVEGAQISDTFQTSHPLLPSGVYQEYTFSSSLIEYVNPSEAGAASATSVATRMLSVFSRQPDVLRARVKADPRIGMGATIGVKDSAVRLGTAKNYFVYSVDTTLRGAAFDQQLTLDGGTGSAGYTTIPNPDASFTWTLDAETLDGDPVVAVFLDGSGSASLSGGEIVSYDWSTSATTYGGTADTASGVNAVFVFLTSASPVDVTLSVTDTTSKIGTLSQTIDLTEVVGHPIIRRGLSVAFGAAWYATADGGATWQNETSNGDAIAVGIIGAGIDSRAGVDAASLYGIIATRGSGGTGLRQSLDYLATASTNLVSAGGAITSNLWVNEADPARVWFAVGTAVYRSTDGGATKTAMAAAPASVKWIMEDPALDNSVFIAAGAHFYVTTDPTAGWTLYYSGPTGATARCFVRSRDGQVTWIAYTGTFTGSPLQRIENGAAVTFPGATSEIQALALNKDATALAATIYAIDSENPPQIFSADGLSSSTATAGATWPSGSTVQHMLGDPDVDLFYVADFDSVAAGTGAIRKYLPGLDTVLLMKEGAGGQQAHMIGLAASATLTASVYLIPYGASGAADFIWKYSDGAWSGIAPPAASYYWRWIAVCPFDDQKILLLGNNATTGNADYYSASGGVVKTQDGAHSPLWLSTDGGASWNEISLASPNGNGAAGNTRAVPRVEWSPQDGTAWYVCRTDLAAGKTSTLWRGTDATAASPVTDTTTTAAQHIIPLVDGVVYITPAAGAGNAHKASYFDASDVFHTPAGSSLGTLDGSNVAFGDRVGLTSAILMSTLDGAIYGTEDYSAAQPTLIDGNYGYSLAVVDSTAYIGSGTGVTQVIDPFGAATVSTVYASGAAVGAIRSDRATQTHAAVIVFDGSDVFQVGVFDGSNWATLSIPSAADPAAIYDFVEIVVSE